jgi:RNA polymerase sigma factor (sigma-70 family)
LQEYTFPSSPNGQNNQIWAREGEPWSGNVPLEGMIPGGEGSDPGSIVATAEIVERVDEFIEELPEAERVILRLSIAGRQPEEIARMEDVNRKYVYNKLHSARSKVRVFLEEQGVSF